MYHPWIPNSDPVVKNEMLRYIGKDLEDLLRDIPEKIRLREPLRVGFGRPLSELEIERLLDEMLSQNKVFRDPPPFLGGGLCPHYVPSVVKYLLLRGEFYTAYTPYQAEINQGVLQALFEYQSMVADLYGVDVVNASMYDVSTATAEAFRMVMRVTKKRGILVPRRMNPFIKRVVETWINPVGGFLVRYEIRNGEIIVLDKFDPGDVGGLYLENPSFLGEVIEETDLLSDYAKRNKLLFVVNADPISLGLFKAPGEYGADIVVGNGSVLGNGLNYGGPSLGILGIRMDQELLRQLPGRLIGATTDLEGSSRGFAMILQTREQHIRRERATSNITTNSALMAIAAAIYLSYLGDKGLKRLAETILKRTMYLKRSFEEKLRDKCVVTSDKKLFFKEVPVRFIKKDYREIHRYLLSRGVHGGLFLGELFEDLGNTSLFCVTEVHSKRHIDLLIDLLAEAI